jgi:hypothetical protein
MQISIVSPLLEERHQTHLTYHNVDYSIGSAYRDQIISDLFYNSRAAHR